VNRTQSPRLIGSSSQLTKRQVASELQFKMAGAWPGMPVSSPEPPPQYGGQL
jgi:hypothetical protein